MCTFDDLQRPVEVVSATEIVANGNSTVLTNFQTANPCVVISVTNYH